MHRSLNRIDASQLTQEELDYEISIRPAVTADEEEAEDVGAATPGYGVNSPLGRVIQKMNIEYRTGQPPESMGQVPEGDTEKITTEINTCQAGLNEVYDSIESISVQAQITDGETDEHTDVVPHAIPLTSRLIHYQNRLNRLPRNALTPDQIGVVARMRGKIAMIKNSLGQFVTHGIDGLPMLLRDVQVNLTNREPIVTDPPQDMHSTLNDHARTNGVEQNGPQGPTRQANMPTPLPRQANPMTASTYANLSSGVDAATENARRVNFSFQSDGFAQDNHLFRPTTAPQDNQQQSQQYAPFRATHNAQETEQWAARMASQYDRNQRADSRPMQGPAQTTFNIPNTNDGPYGQQYANNTEQRHQPGQVNTRPVMPTNETWNVQNPQEHAPIRTNTQENRQGGMNEPTNFAQQQNRRQSVHFAPPNPYNTIPLISQPQVNAINTSASSAYHPATTPFINHYSDDPLNLRQGNFNVPVIDQLSSTGSAPRNQTMNAYQSQQFLGRMLGYRKYDGYALDHAKYVPLDEFISLIRMFHKSTGGSEQEVLSHMATFMTGAAFTWWKNNSPTVHTIYEMENRLRMRFERQSNDPISNVVEFACRKQGDKEDLLDYIDEMRQRLDRCGPALPQERAIETIVNNANETYNRMLAARPYPTLEMLNRHAEYLMKGSKPKRNNAHSHQSNQRFDRRQNSQPSRNNFNSMEINEIQEEEGSWCENESDQVSCDDEQVNEPDVTLATELAALLTNWQGKRTGGPPPKPQNKNGQTNKGCTSTAKTVKTPTQQKIISPEVCRNCLVWGHNHNSCSNPRKIYCHGCGQPDVYKNNCEYCKENQSKNEKAAQ